MRTRFIHIHDSLNDMTSSRFCNMAASFKLQLNCFTYISLLLPHRFFFFFFPFQIPLDFSSFQTLPLIIFLSTLEKHELINNSKKKNIFYRYFHYKVLHDSLTLFFIKIFCTGYFLNVQLIARPISLIFFNFPTLPTLDFSFHFSFSLPHLLPLP